MNAPDKDGLSRMSIPHSRPVVTEDDIQSVANTMRLGRLAQGEEVAALENDLHACLGGHAVAVSSGTAALCLALRAMGIEAGMKVVIPAYTCNSLYAAVIHAGGTPVCADTGTDSVNLAPDTVRPVLSPDTFAIIAPHTCGYLSDIEGLTALGLPVIEDCAQAFGAGDAQGVQPGTLGTMTVLSFYATKLIGAGEGGACITSDAGTAERIRAWRDADEKPPHPAAFNYKMTDLCAVLARNRLKQIKHMVSERNQLAAAYDKLFGAASFRSQASSPQAVCFRYLLDASDRVDSFIENAAAKGIACRRPIWKALHHTLGGQCPNTEQLEKRLVSIPLYPGLSTQEATYICRTLYTLMP